MYIVLALVVLGVGLLVYSLSQAHRDLRVVFLDVGQGDATLIQTPLGKNILVDTGPGFDIDYALARYMDASDRHIDTVILTHPDTDHVSGTLTLLDRYQVDRVFHSGLMAGAPIYSTIAEKTRSQKIPSQRLVAGQKLLIEPGLYFEVLWPQQYLESLDSNDYSIVLQLVYGDKKILLPGDIPKHIEVDIVDVYGSSLGSDILKLSHHGSSTSTHELFMDAVAPEYSIVSAACSNRFGHPHGEVLNIVYHEGSRLLDTCRDGDIVFEFKDGDFFLKNK